MTTPGQPAYDGFPQQPTTEPTQAFLPSQPSPPPGVEAPYGQPTQALPAWGAPTQSLPAYGQSSQALPAYGTYPGPTTAAYPPPAAGQVYGGNQAYGADSSGPGSYGPAAYGPASYGPGSYGVPVYQVNVVHAPAYLASGQAISSKSRTVASLLSFFLGVLGVDRFYLGNIGMGVAKLLLGWATFGIWPLIDFIVIVAGSAHDGDGARVVRWE